ncbi:class I SAM-dependent DNA methyltransferase [Micromonospora sp. LOL_023]|uniref:class I SAM-dependent DNA methyltransferase n=1 Tax=Micromonospora sp. LOL_023 TaxID=3345418 RepID=UPI003A88A170
MTSSDLWDEQAAQSYDEGSAEMFAPHVLDPTVEFLAQLAGAGNGFALEFAIGTGRVAIPLLAKGIPVSGIELSQHMVNQLRRKIPLAAEDLPVVVGDMATATVPGQFSLVYVVYNSIGNLRTQDEQVECFRNAARHLSPGGRFVVELWVPGIRRFPPGQSAVPFKVTDRHVGFDTFDMVTQQGTSHHYRRRDDGNASYGASNFRYIWPAECDLMARLAGLELEQRVADWDGSPFTSDSEKHVSVWRKPPSGAAPRSACPADHHEA